MYTDHFKSAPSPTGHGEGELPGLMKVRQDSRPVPWRTSIVSTREDTEVIPKAQKSPIFSTRMQGAKTGGHLGFGHAEP